MMAEAETDHHREAVSACHRIDGCSVQKSEERLGYDCDEQQDESFPMLHHWNVVEPCPRP
jgi:hypothetical protein